ncbi:hypothetical protein G6F56_013446 [Rhizopus delemar]|nr:hypothetical protein G6F56_013446 [Rhizopus delemar]
MEDSTKVNTGKKRTSSVLDAKDSDSASKFGSRLLTENNDVFSQNAWDHVEWDEEQEEIAKEKILKQLECPVPEDEQGR